MAYNTSRYWVDKEHRAEVARNHTELMAEEFAEEIEDCVAETYLYDTNFKLDLNDYGNNETDVNIIVCDLDSVAAILEYKDNITAVLNFASFKNPGGMFLNGSKAQEECLCH